MRFARSVARGDAVLRLLCVTAHPDDEAGGFGGSLLLYRRRGIETYVLCLTPGAAATHRGSARSEAELAALRRQEFARACELLEVTQGEVLDFPDGSLDREEPHRACGVLVERIRRIRPQVVMTFGPEGAITGHPDHSMACAFTTLAFQWAGRSNRYPEQLANGLRPWRAQKLYYATNLFTMPERPPLAPPPVTISIDVQEHLATKISAFRAHQSQAPLFPFFESVMRDRSDAEVFHLAATHVPRRLEPETDLFAGVEDDDPPPA
jgi:LmbE family N-acetylglucosaminyl deacetylase